MKLALCLVTVMALGGAAQAAEMNFAPMALNSFSAVPNSITAAPVMDQSGNVVGKVQRVVAGYDGKPAAMSYTTRDGRLVLVAAVAVSYDGQRNLVVTADVPQRIASR